MSRAPIVIRFVPPLPFGTGGDGSRLRDISFLVPYEARRPRPACTVYGLWLWDRASYPLRRPAFTRRGSGLPSRLHFPASVNVRERIR